MVAAHRAEMRSLELAVDEESAAFEFLHLVKTARKGYQGKLAGAGAQREHALAAEYMSRRDAIQSSDKHISLPYLHTGCHSRIMKSGICINNRRTKPCPIALYA